MTKPVIPPYYLDQEHQRRKVPQSTLNALDALFATDPSPQDCPPIVVRNESGPLIFSLPDPLLHRKADHWRITLESGQTIDGALVGSTITVEAGLPPGYHLLRLARAGQTLAETSLILAPQGAFLPPLLASGGRVWGIAVQLYALRSSRNWGIGDFTDLVDLIGRAAQAGASLVGVNPLHSLFPADPEQASPYSPSSRDYLNILYIDPEIIPDFNECEPARRLRQSPEFRERIQSLRKSSLVRYTDVAELKLSIFELLHRNFRETHFVSETDERGAAFRVFRRNSGAALRRFAQFQALHEHFVKTAHIYDWSAWPKALQDPASDAVSQFTAENEARVEFFEYLQWQASLQLRDCIARTRSARMPIGLYLDIAVGVARNAAATWSNQAYWMQGWSIGAPPDSWNPRGQDWGLPPPHPAQLQAQGYAGFRTMLRANMTENGAIRLDHILGLMRLFWVPRHEGPAEGAYVHYPFDDLLAIVALESQRHRCVVIGEDLGTVPDGLPEHLHRQNILSYRLLYFERDSAGFRRPDQWERCAIAAITTHDLPTLPGYWSGSDIELKAKLGILSATDDVAREQNERDRDRIALRNAIAAADIEVGDSNEPPIEAAHRFLASTRSMIMMLQLEDLLNVSGQINMPGTVDEYPNWRRKLPQDLDDIFADPTVCRTLKEINAVRGTQPSAQPASDERLRIPASTYRLQFGAAFTFKDATALVPYLKSLGVSHIYASPFLKARPGSTHGYDITDHNTINPEIGAPADLDILCDTLRRSGMGLVLDFIPNHMGINKADNSLWLDVLEWGQDSPFAEFFDINWSARLPASRGRIVVPVLGDHYGLVLERGEIQLKLDAATGSLNFWYHDHCFPLGPQFYATVLRSAAKPGAGEALRALIDDFCAVTELIASAPRDKATRETVSAQKQALARLCASDPHAFTLIGMAVNSFVGQLDNSNSWRRMHELLEQQSYRLASWRVAGDEINFRRFFDINDLAGLRMDRPEVFEHTHRLVGRLIAEGKIQGLRLDHLDGLLDPADYLDRLQRLAAEKRHDGDSSQPFYVVVEKILAPHETLREDWPIAGTTGYEFITLVNGLQVNPESEPLLESHFQGLMQRPKPFEDILYECKLLVMETLLASELNMLAADLDGLSEQHWSTRDYTFQRLHAALREVVAHFPVYRTYVSRRGVADEDRRYIDWAIGKARRTYTGPDKDIFDFIQSTLTAELSRRHPSYDEAAVLRFAMRFQQYTSPVMAKSLEDTSFYRYVRLISANEVGSDPSRFTMSPAGFHRTMELRAKRWPHGMNTLSTHDTKRGEDARARLNVLSEISAEWTDRVSRWSTLNQFRRKDAEDGKAPDLVDEYFIYQTLLGAWPAEWTEHRTIEDDGLADFRQRVRGTITKSLREAKRRTNWHTPNESYENACLDFSERILEIGKPNPFLDDFRDFVARIAQPGVFNSLSQTVLKLTAPGVPDIYQGSELWDFSMVDPDNRRPVLFETRALFLERSSPTCWRDLLEHWQDGHIKLRLIQKLISLRNAERDLFLNGSYEPVAVEGTKADHAVAFLRRFDDKFCLVVVGRFYTGLFPQQEPYSGDAWDNTSIAIEGDTLLRDVLHERTLDLTGDRYHLTSLLNELPVGVFIGSGQRK